jgi:hypothetical protein
MITRIQWQSPGAYWAVATGMVIAVAAIVWLYHPQVRGFASRWSWILLTLRSVSLCVLSLVLLKPAILTPIRGQDRPVLAVLVDQSASMSVVDSGRTTTDLVRLAAALGELPPGVRPAKLADLRQSVEAMWRQVEQTARARLESEYARLSGRGIEAADEHMRRMQALLASSVKTTAADAGPPLDQEISHITGDSSAEQIGQIIDHIDQLQAAADEELHGSNEQVRAVCNELSTQPRIELVRRALQGDTGLLNAIGADRQVRVFGFTDSLHQMELPAEELEARGARTDLAGALRELRQQLAPQQIGAVVVFSDGRQVGGDRDQPPPSYDVSMTAVSVGWPVTHDVAIRHVSLPESAFVGETITVRVGVEAPGFSGSTVQVELDVAGQRQIRPVTIAGGAGRAEMSLRLDRPGPAEIAISAQPLEGEVSLANNRVERVVKVTSEMTRVVLLGGVATRDFQLLRNALRRSPGVALVEQLVDATHPAAFRAEQIDGQDVLILSDVPLAALSGLQWDAVGRLVNQRGGSVLIVASEPSIAAAYASNPLAASLMPWRGELQPAWRVWPGEDPVFRIIPASADVLDALRLSSDADVSRLRWNQLPPVFRFVAIPQLKPAARALLIERDSGLPVLTEMRSGAGRVLFLGLNEMWRWRAALGERDGDRVWLQLIRHAAPEPYAAGDGEVSLDVDRLRVEPGGDIHVRARFRSDPQQGMLNPMLRLDGQDANVRTQQLAPAAGTVHGYEATLTDLPEGEHVLWLIAGGHQLSIPIRVAPSDEDEMRDVSGDDSALRRLVGPRGLVLPLFDMPLVLNRLAQLSEVEPQLGEMRLWDSPYFFLFVLGCLGLEWAVRKRVGLV